MQAYMGISDWEAINRSRAAMAYRPALVRSDRTPRPAPVYAETGEASAEALTFSTMGALSDSLETISLYRTFRGLHNAMGCPYPSGDRTAFLRAVWTIRRSARPARARGVNVAAVLRYLAS